MAPANDISLTICVAKNDNHKRKDSFQIAPGSYLPKLPTGPHERDSRLAVQLVGIASLLFSVFSFTKHHKELPWMNSKHKASHRCSVRLYVYNLRLSETLL